LQEKESSGIHWEKRRIFGGIFSIFYLKRQLHFFKYRKRRRDDREKEMEGGREEGG
jgi:hypothetical protein